MSWWLSMASQTHYPQDYSRKLVNQYCVPGVSWSAVTSKVASATSRSHSGLHNVGSADWRKSGERDPMKVESRTILSVNKCLGLFRFVLFIILCQNLKGPLHPDLCVKSIQKQWVQYGKMRTVLALQPTSSPLPLASVFDTHFFQGFILPSALNANVRLAQFWWGFWLQHG